jgi:hypothetical protein
VGWGVFDGVWMLGFVVNRISINWINGMDLYQTLPSSFVLPSSEVPRAAAISSEVYTDSRVQSFKTVEQSRSTSDNPTT